MGLGLIAFELGLKSDFGPTVFFGPKFHNGLQLSWTWDQTTLITRSHPICNFHERLGFCCNGMATRD